MQSQYLLNEKMINEKGNHAKISNILDCSQDFDLQLQFGLVMISIKQFKRFINASQLKRIFGRYFNLRDETKRTKLEVNKWNDLQKQVKDSQQPHTIQLYQKFLKQQENYQQHWNAHLELAKIYSDLKNHRAAINHYLACQKLSPSNTQCYIKMSECLKESGDLFEAMSILQRGLEKCKDKDALCYRLGDIYCNLEEYSKCFELYSIWKDSFNNSELKIAQIDIRQPLIKNINDVLLKIVICPQDNQLLLSLKDIFLSNDKLQQGTQFFNNLLQKRYNFATLFALGSLLFESGSCLDAKSYLLGAYQLQRQHYLVNLYLATIAQHQNKFSQAICYFQRAYSIDSSGSQPLSCIGFVSMNNGDSAKAATYFSKALASNPNDVLALTSLGILKISANQFRQGITLLYKAIELDHDNQLAISKLKSMLTILGQQDQLANLELKLKNIHKK